MFTDGEKVKQWRETTETLEVKEAYGKDLVVCRETTKKTKENLVDPREYVYCQYRQADAQVSKVSFLDFSVEHSSCPPGKDAMRGQLHYRLHELRTDGNLTSVTAVGCVVPGGNVPKPALE